MIQTKTQRLQMNRGTTLQITDTVLDDTGAPVDLTGGEICFVMRADVKAAPSVQLTSNAGPAAPWRTGVVLAAQSGATLGQYTATLIPSDTETLIALGADDPWFYEIYFKDAAGNVFPHYTRSQLDLYQEIGMVI